MRILIADDSIVSRHLLEATLRKWGYDAVVACDGFEAWGLAKKVRFDLIITDSQMPRLSGVEFVARVRDLHPALPILRIGHHPRRSDVHRLRLQPKDRPPRLG